MDDVEMKNSIRIVSYMVQKEKYAFLTNEKERKEKKGEGKEKKKNRT